MEKDKGKEKKKTRGGGWFNTFVFAILIGFVFLGIEFSKEFYNSELGLIDVLEDKMLDIKFRSRGQLPTQNKVVIAAVDEKSLDKYGLWPWDRKLVAQLVNKLNEKGAAVIGFDVIFSEEDKNSLKRKLIDLRGELFPDIPTKEAEKGEEEETEEEAAEENEKKEDGKAANVKADAKSENAKSKPNPDENAKEIINKIIESVLSDEKGKGKEKAQDASLSPSAIEKAKLNARKEIAHHLDEVIAQNDSDQALAEAIENAEGKLVLGFFIFAGKEETLTQELSRLNQTRLKEDLNLMLTSKITLLTPLTPNAPIPPFPSGMALRSPLSMFAEKTDYFGHFTFVPDRDGTMRWAILAHRVDVRDNMKEVMLYPALSLKCAAVYLGKDSHNIEINYYDAGVQSVAINYIDQKTQKKERVLIPTDHYGRMIINHRGPKYTFPHISAADILSDAPNVDVKDKIVLIGATATAVYDLRVTPFEETFPGVEIHANIVDNILGRQFLVRPYGWAWFFELSCIAFFMLIFGLAIHRLPALYSFLVVASAIAAFVLIDRYYLFLNGHVIRSMLVLTAGISIAALSYIFRYFAEERERKKIRGMFSFYLNDDVIKELESDPSKMALGGERKELTMLFSDIAGFTTISEKMQPETITKLLNRYLTPMTDVVFKNYGLLDKYIGDAVMAVFGTPYQEDHAFRACKTAVEMQKKINELRDLWKEHGVENFNARIGLNTGPVSVGNMGSDMRFDYTVIGDAVNLASRLEGINKQYGTLICISETTYEAVKGRVVARELDAVKVKGKKEAVKIYELIDIGAPSAEQSAWIDAYEEALMHYRQRDWRKAVELFKITSELKGSVDYASELFIERVQYFMQNNPDEDWDGSWIMKTK